MLRGAPSVTFSHTAAECPCSAIEPRTAPYSKRNRNILNHKMDGQVDSYLADRNRQQSNIVDFEHILQSCEGRFILDSPYRPTTKKNRSAIPPHFSSHVDIIYTPLSRH